MRAVIFLAAVIACAGCQSTTETTRQGRSAVKINRTELKAGGSHQDSVDFVDFDHIVTVGNHSYLSLNFEGNPHEHVELFLNIIQKFEEQFSDLEIVAWRIQRDQSSKSHSARIHGIWIDHKEKLG